MLSRYSKESNESLIHLRERLETLLYCHYCKKLVNKTHIFTFFSLFSYFKILILEQKKKKGAKKLVYKIS